MSKDDLTGDGQDVCSFFAGLINQRQSVERLLNWLRESQTTCTDTNCFDDLSGLPGSEHGSPLMGENPDGQAGDGEPFQLILWFVFGLLTLYALNLSRGRNMVRNEKLSNFSEQNPPRRDHDRDDDSRPAL